MFTEDNLSHNMTISILYPMFEEKIANKFEKMVLLKGNLPIFVSLNFPIRIFINVWELDCVMNMAVL